MLRRYTKKIRFRVKIQKNDTEKRGVPGGNAAS